MNEYFVQFGIIIFPITVYQIWTFGKSFNQLPFKFWILGLYGGGAAILCQLMPVHILGQTENFQCVPLVLAILYGKRKVGLLSIGIVAGYQMIAWQHTPDTIASITGILLYSALPMIFCTRFDRLAPKKRFIITQLLSAATLIIQLLFVVALFLLVYGKEGLNQLAHHVNFLGIACVIQLVMMGTVFFLLESIIDAGRVRSRQESLIRYNPLGISVFDTNNCFVAVNPAYEAMTGYKEHELLGKSRLRLWFEDTHDYAETVLNYALHGEIKRDVETTLRHKKGHSLPVRFTLVPMLEDQSIVGYFVMLTDITESKVAEEFVRNSEKLSAIGQLAAGVAHEIRNPLTAIKGFLQLLFSTGSPSQAKYYDIMKSEIARIEGIISEMLVLAKPQATSFRLVNVRNKLEESAFLIIGEANLQNVEVTVDFSQANPVLMADENQLKQVFLNLGKNAIEAMPEGGALKISMRQEQDTVIVRFTDNGHGIPRDILQKIGEPFFTTKAKGTGLGFLISKRIIADHNGEMYIQSNPGEGTSVELRLPVYKEHDEAVPFNSESTCL